MAEKTGIAWTDSTFNPWVSCTKVSPACDNCYAEKWGARFGYKWGPGQPRHRTSASTWRQPLVWNRKAERQFSAWEQFKKQYTGLTDAQLEAQGFHKPTRPRVFCGSLCDVFDNEVPNEWRFDLFRLIESTPNLDWLLLTKRIGNANAMLPFEWNDGGRANVWIGATICNQEEADRDIPKLLAVPAAKRFVSIEPMLGPIDLSGIGETYCGKTAPELRPLVGLRREETRPYHDERTGYRMVPHPKIDWVICGGETGKHARPMHPSWVRSLRDQCVAARVPFFFKQWGEFDPVGPTDRVSCDVRSEILIAPDGLPLIGAYNPKGTWTMRRVGHKAAGNLLDGRTWTEVPA